MSDFGTEKDMSLIDSNKIGNLPCSGKSLLSAGPGSKDAIYCASSLDISNFGFALE